MRTQPTLMSTNMWHSGGSLSESAQIRPDTLRGLVTQLRYLAWVEIGSDYADKP